MSLDDEIDELAIRLERLSAQNQEVLSEVEITGVEEISETPPEMDDVEAEDLFS